MGSGQLITYVKCDLIFVEQCSIHRSRAKYILRKKKTNELQVHPYKLRNRLVGMNLQFICFFLPQYICMYGDN